MLNALLALAVAAPFPVVDPVPSAALAAFEALASHPAVRSAEAILRATAGVGVPG